METKIPVSTKKAFLISFSSILVVCVLAFISIFVYIQIRQSINNKNYQRCLDEQVEANKEALAYIPIIDQVEMKRSDQSLQGIDHIIIRGKIDNSKIEKLEMESQGGGEIIKKFQLNSDGGFIYEIRLPNYSSALNPNFNLKIIPKDRSIICTTKSDLAKADVCTLENLSLDLNPADNSWCMSGIIDIGLGSAPVFALSEAELQTIGLAESNICNQRTSNWRNKCINKNSTDKFFLF